MVDVAFQEVIINVDVGEDTAASQSAATRAEVVAASVVGIAALNTPWLATVTDPADRNNLLVPAFDFIPSEGRLWRDGTTRNPATDLTDHGDGSYSLNTIPAGLNAGTTIYIDYDHTEGDAIGADSHLYSQAQYFLVGGFEVFLNNSDGLKVPKIQLTNRAVSGTSAITRGRYGYSRLVISLPNNAAAAPMKLLCEDQAVAAVGGNVDAYGTPGLISIGRRIGDGYGVPSGITIKRITIYAGALSEAQMQAVLDRLDANPIPAMPAALPAWLPSIAADDGSRLVPLAHLDWQRKRYWFENAERARADIMTQKGSAPNQAWVLKRAPRGMRPATGLGVMFDWSPAEQWQVPNTPPSGYFVQGFNALVASPTGSSGRFEFAAQIPGGFPRVSFTADASGATTGTLDRAAAIEVDESYRNGIHRNGLSLPAAGSPCVSIDDAFPVGTSGGTSALDQWYEVPDWWGFMGRATEASHALTYGSPLTNATLEAVTIWPRALTATEAQRAANWNEYGLAPLWSHGDSFQSADALNDALRIHLRRQGRTYLPMMFTGEGGKGLSWHYLFLADVLGDFPLLADYVLVLNEGGFDIANQQDLAGSALPDLTKLTAVQKVRDIAALFRNKPFVYLEAHTNLVATVDAAAGNSNGITELRGFLDAIKATFPQAYAPTNRRLQSVFASAASYDAAVLSGATPAALQEDTIHLHGPLVAFDPAVNGQYHRAIDARDQLAAIGWAP